MDLTNNDFFHAVNYLEESHRHDLAVHLYLTFLLHRVNPFFPRTTWANWPTYTVVDPTLREDYEDVLVETGDLGEEEESAEEIVDDDAREDLNVHVQRSLHQNVQHQQRRKTSPKVHLVNEIHALLLRTIRKKAAQRGRELVEDSEVTRALALQLAGRVARTLTKIKQQKCSGEVTTWQHVLLADATRSTYGEKVDVDRCRTLYERANKLFAAEYPYEYNEEYYNGSSDTDSAYEDAVPEFNAEDHLGAIEEQQTMPVRQATALEVLAERERAREFRENMFWQVLEQAKRRNASSWQALNNALGARDFEVGYRYE